MPIKRLEGFYSYLTLIILALILLISNSLSRAQTLPLVISIPISAACMPSLMRMVSGWVQQTPALTVLSNTPTLELTGIFGYFFRLFLE